MAGGLMTLLCKQKRDKGQGSKVTYQEWLCPITLKLDKFKNIWSLEFS